MTVLENQKRIVSPTSDKLFLWSIDRVICQLEGCMVDCDAGLGTENFVGSNSFFGSHVHRQDKPAWLICTGGQ